MTIYIDVTDTLITNANSGIQRVSRNLINHGLMLKNNNIKIKCVYFSKNLGPIIVENIESNALLDKIGYSYNFFEQINRPFHIFNILRATLPLKNIREIYDTFWISYVRYIISIPLLVTFFFALLYSTINIHIRQKPKHFIPKNGDILIIPGKSWWKTSQIAIKRGIDLFRRNGSKTATLIHDIIAISHRNLCQDSTSHNISKHLPSIIKSSDLLIANSKTTQITINHYIKHYLKISDKKTSFFYLGYDFSNPNRLPTTPIRKKVNNIFRNPNVFISVGTIEPRKNLSYILDSFDKIWENNQNTTLCIIGKYGWKSKHIIKRIKEHNNYNKRLFWLTDICDQELQYCYKQAKATISASIIEGFGLPVIESLMLGTPVLASDIPIYREICENNCKYFSLTHPEELTFAIKQILDSNSLYESIIPTYFSWPTWEDSAISFFSNVLNHLPSKPNILAKKHVV